MSGKSVTSKTRWITLEAFCKVERKTPSNLKSTTRQKRLQKQKRRKHILPRFVRLSNQPNLAQLLEMTFGTKLWSIVPLFYRTIFPLGRSSGTVTVIRRTLVLPKKGWISRHQKRRRLLRRPERCSHWMQDVPAVVQSPWSNVGRRTGGRPRGTVEIQDCLRDSSFWTGKFRFH